jgi:hypothetical protein
MASHRHKKQSPRLRGGPASKAALFALGVLIVNLHYKFNPEGKGDLQAGGKSEKFEGISIVTPAVARRMLEAGGGDFMKTEGNDNNDEYDEENDHDEGSGSVVQRSSDSDSGSGSVGLKQLQKSSDGDENLSFREGDKHNSSDAEQDSDLNEEGSDDFLVLKDIDEPSSGFALSDDNVIVEELNGGDHNVERNHNAEGRLQSVKSVNKSVNLLSISVNDNLLSLKKEKVITGFTPTSSSCESFEHETALDRSDSIEWNFDKFLEEVRNNDLAKKNNLRKKDNLRNINNIKNQAPHAASDFPEPIGTVKMISPNDMRKMRELVRAKMKEYQGMGVETNGKKGKISAETKKPEHVDINSLDDAMKKLSLASNSSNRKSSNCNGDDFGSHPSNSIVSTESDAASSDIGDSNRPHYYMLTGYAKTQDINNRSDPGSKVTVVSIYVIYFPMRRVLADSDNCPQDQFDSTNLSSKSHRGAQLGADNYHPYRGLHL